MRELAAGALLLQNEVERAGRVVRFVTIVVVAPVESHLVTSERRR